MKRKRFSVEQIVAAVKQHDLGVSATDIARKLGSGSTMRVDLTGLSRSSRPSNSRPFGSNERQKFTD